MNKQKQLNEDISSKKKLELLMRNLHLDLDKELLMLKSNRAKIPEVYNISDVDNILIELQKFYKGIKSFVEFYSKNSGYQEIDHTTIRYRKMLPIIKHWITQTRQNDISWIYEK
jgi:hypothetical protein